VTDDQRLPCAGSVIEAVLQVAVREEQGVAVVTVRGEVDLLTAPRLAAVLTEEADGRTPVLVADLSEVDFFGAAGLEALSQAARRAGAAGVSFRLVVGPQVRHLLSLLGSERPLPAYENLIEAVR
jgi:anti-anti-sigma factor